MNVGLVGCGRVFEIQMNTHKNTTEANVIAVSSINIDRVKVVALKYGIKKLQ